MFLICIATFAVFSQGPPAGFDDGQYQHSCLFFNNAGELIVLYYNGPVCGTTSDWKAWRQGGNPQEIDSNTGAWAGVSLDVYVFPCCNDMSV